ncbi:YkgB family protein [Bradyrhizobium centrosematis]|uniref:YkgB family protein n=1 Tax=Bradyrhizobium centrosematis TaxID=1300039 RepID=UPI00216A9EF9|nr:YkgB family protein [Bradyrhizobium centrosematis]MCS3763105.1 putative membrane protein YkgB [Bradyrhizobium centrosematis]MCS3775772.1 putative membrane protein YkgB [Bradyrhizobium centrosematis]
MSTTGLSPTHLPLALRHDLRDRIARFVAHAEPVSRVALYVSLAAIYAWFGGMKFTAYEAQGLVPLVENSPLLSWFYALFSIRGFADFLGGLELSIGLLIALRAASPVFSAAGGLISTVLFLTTVSFMFSTPGVIVPELGVPAITVAPGQFLLKDIGLFAASFWIFVDSLKAMLAKRRALLGAGTHRIFSQAATSFLVDPQDQ